ncbi:methionyl-tRNA formyltransferase [Candidatus Peregrinibacteria bacterium]|jgi:methionyl-tRNA formyltransferase|nr:methionyl-tRNA formyltransferase [Candidatus Peregrinibacteria bacterium]MBT3599064.1 methionyl-tRNA formyltransferase [Candidatus Peregrinibacteria bacterium]MBT4585678.1 methionyl-tRNA formyltransferase [Candidatus Peregrinibacteria bacterium]MBT6730630.1 methionyl-tRNA formyltransferase [Candidatus Peregrinibacteria bacterium]MBT7009812.1 methionyl-tRNA formyltransferase [Candidatus Peregrinibacteria bacterium]
MANSFSVIFAGTPDFAVPSLRALVESDSFNVIKVITQPDKPIGRKQIITPPAIKIEAKKYGLPIWQPININKEWEEVDEPFDFFVTVAFGQLLSQEILDSPRIEAVNLHGSLLPKWRGASPMQSALLSGDKVTGVTLQKMVKQIDAGDTLSTKEHAMKERETLESLHDSLAIKGAALLVETLQKTLNPMPQDESQATHCSKLAREDGNVDASNMTAEEIDRKVRALVPWPGVTTKFENQTIKLLETSLEECDESLPITCANNSILYIKRLVPAGGKQMTGAAWGRGNKG